MTEPRPGLYVFDTGQNLAGWAALRVRGPAGTRVELRFAESLFPDGMVNQANLRKAAATDVYILSGQGEDDGHERWEPRFTYHGFRYVEVRGFPGRPGPDALRIRVVRSAVEPNGTFASSHELLNRIDRMVRATEASNLHGVPTDCPQRDERMGWMNDLTVRIEQALFNFRLPRFYAKFLRDVADTQAADGSITDTAPFKWGRRPADPVSVSYLLLAWEVYQHYGDVRPMAEHFAGFARWVDFVAGTAKDGVVPWGSWGDWSPPAAFAQAGSAGAGAISAQTPLPLMSTGYLAYSAELLARMASVLGKPAERRRYEQLAKQTTAAFDRAFWNAERGGYGQSNQAANAFALALGLAPEARRPQILASLLGNVRDANDHLTTGNLCTKYLLDALSDGGHADAAARIATQRTYPSWGFMLDNGATTLWERWEHLTGGQMNSHNHPMMGSIGAWLFTALGGLRPDPAGPGWSRFFVRPKVVPSVTWVRVTHASPYGKIASAWRVAGGALALQVTVPPNSAATIAIPGRAGDITEGGQPAARAAGVRFLGNEAGAALFEVGAGSYSFVSRGFAGGGGGR
jgi:alpha-L-rhamnosidase